MATLKDIAKLAGVSHGTVSNVLSGKENVSSDKIMRVQAAAKQLGYTVNTYAKSLRQGSAKILALVLPNIDEDRYNDIYYGFKVRCEMEGYELSLCLTNDIPSRELSAIGKLRSDMVMGIAAVSCLTGAKNQYVELGFEEAQIVFLERKPSFRCSYIGFDYYEAGANFGKRAAKKGVENALITSAPLFSNEADFVRGFNSDLTGEQAISLRKFSVDRKQSTRSLIKILDASEGIKNFFVSDCSIAKELCEVDKVFFTNEEEITVYTLSPIHVLPKHDYKTYEFNYTRMGNVAAEKLLSVDGAECTCEIIPSDGFRNWNVSKDIAQKPDKLKMLLLNGPDAFAAKSLSKMYTKQTGIEIDIDVRSYDEIFDILNQTNGEAYDILRIDITYLSWFVEKTLRPLDEIDENIGDVLERYLDGVNERYSTIMGKVYTLPFDPSVMLLYYRKDLFESSINKRLYHEKYKCELRIPETFEEFNQIASFFSKSNNADSPTEYGAGITLGNVGVASSEFLSRFFEKSRNLYDDDGKVRLNSVNGKKAMQELLELKQSVPLRGTDWWTDTASAFAMGKIAMAILYSNYAFDLLKDDLDLTEQIGYTYVPGHNPILGGASLGVSRFSKHPEAALEYIKWLTSEAVSSASTYLGGVSVCKAAYDDYRLMNAYPWLTLAKKSFLLADGNRQRTGKEGSFNERLFTDIIGMATQNVLNGVQSVDEALAWAQNEFDRCF